MWLRKPVGEIFRPQNSPNFHCLPLITRENRLLLKSWQSRTIPYTENVSIEIIYWFLPRRNRWINYYDIYVRNKFDWSQNNWRDILDSYGGINLFLIISCLLTFMFIAHCLWVSENADAFVKLLLIYSCSETRNSL